MEYKKPQSTIIQGNVGIYPLTTADQVILADGTRLEKDGKINVDVANSANSAKLGGKAPEYYLQPRNLLDNSDFKNPVNQRGQTDYTSNGYTIDRWEVYSGAVGVSSLGYITTSGQMYQKIAIPTDKVYTFAIENDAGIALVTGIPENGVSSATLGNALIKLATIDGYTEVVIEPSEGHNLAGAYWAALYEGSYTADTLPPYVPKGYAEELAECQRYYQIIRLYRHLSTIYDNQYRYYGCSLPVKMRTIPTVTIEFMEECKVNSFDKNSLTSYSGESYKSFEGMAISFICKSEQSTVLSQCYANTKIACSADL